MFTGGMLCAPINFRFPLKVEVMEPAPDQSWFIGDLSGRELNMKARIKLGRSA